MKPSPHAERRLRLIHHVPRDKLVALFHQEKDVRMRERLHAILLGYDDPDWLVVSRTLFRSYRAVIAWAKAWNAQGLEGLGRKPIPGRPSQLSQDQNQELAQAVRDGPIACARPEANWTAQGLVGWACERFGVFFSSSWICRLLGRMGFSYRLPDHRYVHASNADRERFLESFVRTIGEMQPRDVLVLADEASVDEHPTLHRAWMPRGNPVTVPTRGTHRKRHVFGIVNPFTGFSLCRITKKLRAVHFVGFMQRILATYPGRRILLVMDNGPTHVAHVVKEFLDAHPRIVPIWLPKYSSDLNPIEELWKLLRHQVTHNRLFAGMNECGNALRAFFWRLPRDVVKSVCSVDYLVHGR